MATSGPSRRPRATRWEILGARLRIWTPPRDVEIPPVSRRAVASTIIALVALLADARAQVDRDVRARVASGRLDGPVRGVRCSYRSGDAGLRVHMECLAITSILVRPKAPAVYVGHPFVVGASLRDGRYAWCKENPPPGEGFAGQGVSVALPAACAR